MTLLSKIIRSILWLFIFINSNDLFAQHASVGLDKMNVVYVGIPNPLTVAMENCPCKDLVVKTSNGVLKGSGCYYVLNPTQVGVTRITVSNGKSKKNTVSVFEYRTKMIPSPAFRIGRYGGAYGYSATKMANSKHLADQQFVRAELENFDFDAMCLIDSFTVTITGDSSITKKIFNITSKINEELHNAFLALQKNDMVIFDKIFAKGPDGIERELEPLVLSITE